jgi:hypothetical protein
MGDDGRRVSIDQIFAAFVNHPSRGKDRENEPVITTALPAPPPHLESAMAAMWLEMKSRGYWLTSADRFLVEIAVVLMARLSDRWTQVWRRVAIDQLAWKDWIFAQ